MKKLLWALGLVVVLLGTGVGWLYQSRDDLLAQAIRSYGPDITGVRVQLGEVHLSPLDGMATLHGLQLGNPAGFKSAHALVVGQLRIQLDPATLTKDVVHIREITVEQPEVGYEYAPGGSNLDAIQRHVQDYVAAHLPAAPGSDAGATKAPQTRLVIDRFDMLGARALVTAELLQGKVVTLVLPDIHLRDIGKRKGGVTPAEATAQMVAAIRQETTKAVLPLHLDGVVDGIKQKAGKLVDRVKGFFK